MSGVSNAAILEWIKGLREDVQEVKEAVGELGTDYRGLKLEYAREHAKMVAAVEETGKTVEDHGKRLVDLEKAVGPLVTANRIMSSLAVIMMSSMVALIWSIITHKVTVGF